MNSKVVFGILSIAFLSAVLFLSFSESGKSSSEAEKIKRGEYLVTVAGCGDCHSPKIMTEQGLMPDPARLLSGHPANQRVPEIPRDYLAPDKWGAVGDNNFTCWAGPWGVSFAANLTPDEVTGIGAWTEDSFIKAMRTGKHLGAGRAILPPMPWFNLAEATDDDLSAMFAYLQSIKPIENMVPPPIPPAGK